MKKIFFVLFFIFINVSAQFQVSAGMGLNFVNSPNFNEYINTNFAPPGSRLNDFNSAIEFYGELDYAIKNNFSLAIDYSNLIFSYNTASYVGYYEISYTHFKPSLLAYYNINGNGYQFKFGAGTGVRIVSLNEKLPNLSSNIYYKSTGYGFLLRFNGNTLLSGDMYANIGADFRIDFPGNLKGDFYLYDNINNKKVNLNGVAFSIKLGITYIL